MTREQAMAIIEQEGLERILWFTDPKNEVEQSGIGEDAQGWFTFVTDERATVMAVERFDGESDALVDLIARAREWQELKAIRRRWRTSEA